jgi:hypothetical protein
MPRMKALDSVGNSIKSLILVGFAASLAACSSGPSGVRFTKGANDKPQAEAIRALSSSEIAGAISGKTFQYTRADGNGFVTYNADGSLSFQDDLKGEGQGRWSFDNGQYCETFGANAVQECGEFKTTGDAFFAAKSRLVEMKI